MAHVCPPICLLAERELESPGACPGLGTSMGVPAGMNKAHVRNTFYLYPYSVSFPATKCETLGHQPSSGISCWSRNEPCAAYLEETTWLWTNSLVVWPGAVLATQAAPYCIYVCLSRKNIPRLPLGPGQYHTTDLHAMSCRTFTARVPTCCFSRPGAIRGRAGVESLPAC